MKSVSSTDLVEAQNNAGTRFPASLSALALLLTAMVFVGFAAHICHLHDINFWSVSSVVALFAFSMTAWLATFKKSSKSHKNLLHNANERSLSENELEADNNLLREIIKGTPDAVFAKDLEGRYLMINSAGAEFFGKTSEDFINRTDYEVYPEDMARRFVEADRQVLESGETRTFEGTAIASNGSLHTYLVTKSVYRNPQGKIVGLVAISHDITSRKQAENALKESEYKLRTLLDSMSEGLVQVNNDEVIEFVNDRFCEMTGFCDEDLIGKVSLDILFDEEGKKFVRKANRQRRKGVGGQYELRLKKKSGELLYVIVGGVPIINADGEIVGTIGVFTDITERKRAEEQLLHDAFHDGLTGLANRSLFMDHLRMAIERAKRGSRLPFAVLFLDFDRFKIINDSLGHAEGDNLLKLVARRLESTLRPGDLTARLGGDEFTILLNDLENENAAVSVAERIQEQLKTPFNLSGREVYISASIGIALSENGNNDRAEDMLRDADIAMYRAKAKGKAQHQIFDRRMHEHASRQLSLETDIRQALGRGEFIIDYQPIINLENEKLIGFEALVRWKHPTRGMISPDEFIPVAEENNLIVPLGRWILQESCRQMHEWQKEYPAAASRLAVNVNLSCKQFLQFDLAEQIAGALIATQLDPRCLKLEITESHVMENRDQAIVMLNRLRSLGVELSLDDFGTGYSSLSYLHRLPVNNLKIDRSFVMRMTESQENSEIVSTIIKLAQNLKMQVIAEGIETEAQMMQLKQLGCEYGQGYFFSKPLDAESAAAFIKTSAAGFSLPIDDAPENLQLIG